MTSTLRNPWRRASSTRSYWRRWLSRWTCTWVCVDWRTYTTALRLRTVGGRGSAFVIADLLGIHADGFHQQAGQTPNGGVAVGGRHPVQHGTVQRHRQLAGRLGRNNRMQWHDEPPRWAGVHRSTFLGVRGPSAADQGRPGQRRRSSERRATSSRKWQDRGSRRRGRW